MTHILKTLAVTAAALALTGCQKPDDAAFGQRVRAYLLEHPEVLQEAALKLAEQQRSKAQKASATAISRLRSQIERDPRDLVINPNGAITVTEFFDYRCGFCKQVAPEVLQIIRDNPDVRFVFKEMPIFGEVSDTAAKIALTSQGKAKGLELYQGWMAEKALDEAAIDRHLRAADLDPAVVRKAAADPAIERQILDVRALAGSLGIEGTPAFIVGDTLVPGADIAALKAAILQAKTKDLKRPSGAPA